MRLSERIYQRGRCLGRNDAMSRASEAIRRLVELGAEIERQVSVASLAWMREEDDHVARRYQARVSPRSRSVLCRSEKAIWHRGSKDRDRVSKEVCLLRRA